MSNHPKSDPLEWDTVSLVTVSYVKGDYLSIFFAYYSLLVYCIPFIYVTLMFRDRHLLTWLCCGSHLVHEVMTKYLKRYIGQKRPEFGPPPGGLFDGPYGMPSQHVSCSAYVATMVGLVLFHHYKNQGTTKAKLSCTMILLTALVIQCQARLYLKYHDIHQVIAGLVHGSIFGLIFYSIIHYSMSLAPMVCRWPLFKHLGFTPDFTVSSNKRLSNFGSDINFINSKRFKNESGKESKYED